MAHPVYRVDGKRVPSVTTILGMYGEKEGLLHWAWQLGIDGKNFREERDRAGGVGTVVHEMVEAAIQERPPHEYTPDELGVDEEQHTSMIRSAGQSFLAFLAWREMTRLKVLCTETSLVSDVGFGGTPDAVGETPDGAACLIDWKSSSRLHHTYIAQVAAYCHLWRKGRLLVDGGYTPARLGETITSAHLLRFDKKHGTFTHAHLNRGAIVKGWKLFDAVRQAYAMDHELKGAI